MTRYSVRAGERICVDVDGSSLDTFSVQVESGKCECMGLELIAPYVYPIREKTLVFWVHKEAAPCQLLLEGKVTIVALEPDGDEEDQAYKLFSVLLAKRKAKGKPLRILLTGSGTDAMNTLARTCINLGKRERMADPTWVHLDPKSHFAPAGPGSLGSFSVQRSLYAMQTLIKHASSSFVWYGNKSCQKTYERAVQRVHAQQPASSSWTIIQTAASGTPEGSYECIFGIARFFAVDTIVVVDNDRIYYNLSTDSKLSKEADFFKVGMLETTHNIGLPFSLDLYLNGSRWSSMPRFLTAGVIESKKATFLRIPEEVKALPAHLLPYKPSAPAKNLVQPFSAMEPVSSLVAGQVWAMALLPEEKMDHNLAFTTLIMHANWLGLARLVEDQEEESSKSLLLGHTSEVLGESTKEWPSGLCFVLVE